jgi:hypothetical protein
MLLQARQPDSVFPLPADAHTPADKPEVSESLQLFSQEYPHSLSQSLHPVVPVLSLSQKAHEVDNILILNKEPNKFNIITSNFINTIY